MKNMIFATIILSIVSFSCKKDMPMMQESFNDAIDFVSEDTIGQGNFVSFAHGVSGNAILVEDTSGQKILRLQNFNMTAGPDVFVFLSTTNSYNAGAVQVSMLAVNTDYVNSNINFSVTSTTYTAAHKFVLIYCVQYSHLFGYVELL